jgi:hypothetical protein
MRWCGGAVVVVELPSPSCQVDIIGEAEEAPVSVSVGVVGVVWSAEVFGRPVGGGVGG